jgi:predicted small secreted protein
MSRAICLFAAGSMLAALSAGSAVGQDKPKDLQWTHAFDLACRKLGEAEFSASTQKFGIEASRDLNLDLGLYVTEKGSIALAGGFGALTPPVVAKGPVWLTGLDLPARKAGEAEFSKNTKIYCLEIFRDANTENALFITSDGNIAAANAKGKTFAGNRAPVWVHSVDVNVRKGGVKEWKDANKIGIEIYRDGNTGHLIYISHTGAIAAIAEVGQTKANDKAPAWLHGLDLSVRRANEPAFGKETRKFGVEVFRDETTGNLMFVGETGSIAVIAGGAKLAAPTEEVKEPTWSHGWNVKARKFGEKEFTERQAFGGEVFRDDNTGAILTISETGAISALRAK